MPNHVYIAVSLDGFIATKDGGIEWLEAVPNPTGSDFGFADFTSRMDALLMGRHTFDKIASFGFWPYTIPVFVLSNTLKVPPKEFEEKIEILSGTPKGVVSKLKDRNFDNLYIDGGQVVQEFLAEDLVDEITITRFPKILGSGIPLFAETEVELDFEHIKTEVLLNQLVKSHYKRKAEPDSGGNG